MDDLLIYLFSLLLAGYIVSKNFLYTKRTEYKYANEHKIKLSVICITIVWCLIVSSFLFRLNILKYMCLSLYTIIVTLEIIKSVIKINDFNKEFKIILKDNDYNMFKKIKKTEIRNSLNNIFIVLGGPLWLLETGIKKILDFIFK